jgi:hypothetical protein
MRIVLSGCAAGADGVIAAKDAQNSLAVKDRAVATLARTQITAVEQQAQAYAATHGGAMDGFAADLQASQPTIAASFVALSDTSLSISVSPGQCLVAELPAGAPIAKAC